MRRLLSVLSIPTLLLAAALPAAAQARTPQLPTFKTCGELVDYASQRVTEPYVASRAGVVTDTGVRLRTAPTVSDAVAMPTSAEKGASGDGTAEPVAGQDFSSTNVQEEAVDEPDIVKTDGRRMFVVVDTSLWALDVTTPTPTVLGKLSLEDGDGQLLLQGNRLLLIGPAPPSRASAKRVAGEIRGPETRLAEIDVTDASAMKIVRTMIVPGQHVSSRLAGGTARIVIQSSAALPVSINPAVEAIDMKRPSAAVRRARARKLGIRAFLPRTTLRSRVKNKTYRRGLVPCDDVRHPRRFSGLDLTTVLTVDLTKGLFNVDRDAVMAAAQVVYGSTGSLYIASQQAVDVTQPGDAPKAMTSEIHRFDASKPGETTYAATGSVPGFVLNQYSLSEFGGVLRVASTTEPLWLQNAEATPSESTISVLQQQGSRLATIGAVGGLGKRERIYAARFIGDRGYLVTFRQVDPLYTVDLSVPAKPRVAGELKITGYSAYLHPIGEHLLLGVGQEASEQGRTLGTQVSIFDVTDPAKPTRLAQRRLGEGVASAAEFDPHAFLWWAPSSLAVLPYTAYVQQDGGYHYDSGAVGLTATRQAGLANAGRITHGTPASPADIVRSVVVADRVLTISSLGISSNVLAGFTPLGFVPFPTTG